jgi:hypothetical protein
MARVVAIALVASCATGCSIRYDATGVTRTGVGLWGFGDPPGVDWNLDWPRREIPELPASRPPQLPPRATDPERRSGNDRTIAPRACATIRHGSPFGDNRHCGSRSSPDSAAVLAVRPFDRGRRPARG